MNKAEKIIVALDFSKKEEMERIVSSLEDTGCAFKIGLESFLNFGVSFVKEFSKKHKVFLDLKFADIPNTVASAIKTASNFGVWMLNLHLIPGRKVLKNVKESLKNIPNQPLIIGVTVLTHMEEKDLKEIGLEIPVEDLALKLAILGKEEGIDGVVCSALEVEKIKKFCGNDFLCIVPGIRLPEDEKNDQARISTPSFAISKGADYLVIGRSITKAESPRTAFFKILENIK
jgi:orotidine-5'-phosphate decarboxylase